MIYAGYLHCWHPSPLSNIAGLGLKSLANSLRIQIQFCNCIISWRASRVKLGRSTRGFVKWFSAKKKTSRFLVSTEQQLLIQYNFPVT